VVEDEDDIMMVSEQGNIIRTKVGGISVIGRNTQGVKLINLSPGEKLVALARLAEPEDDDKDQEENELLQS
jgi:DNA gyrase subunit A